jgi:hypothetical protein
MTNTFFVIEVYFFYDQAKWSRNWSRKGMPRGTSHAGCWRGKARADMDMMTWLFNTAPRVALRFVHVWHWVAATRRWRGSHVPLTWQPRDADMAATWMMTWPNNYVALHGPFPSHHSPLHNPCHSEIYTSHIKFSPHKIHPNRISFYSNSTISTKPI